MAGVGSTGRKSLACGAFFVSGRQQNAPKKGDLVSQLQHIDLPSWLSRARFCVLNVSIGRIVPELPSYDCKRPLADLELIGREGFSSHPTPDSGQFGCWSFHRFFRGSQSSRGFLGHSSCNARCACARTCCDNVSERKSCPNLSNTRMRIRASCFERFEPRMLMTAQAANPPDFTVDYFTQGAATGQVVEQAIDPSAPAGAYYQTGPDAVRAQYGFTGAGQTVAVIDSGIAYDDAALGGGFGSGYKVVGGWDFANNDANPYDDGPAGGHGTNVAGIIGSTDATNLGVAPGVDLVALRVFDDSGAGYFSWIDSALKWVYNNRNSFRNPITTVNLSLGAGADTMSPPAWANLEGDFKLLTSVGIFVSAAAGNAFAKFGTVGLDYPASSPYVVPVMSVGASGQLSSFSERASQAIAAPGENIVSTVPDYVGNHDGVDNDWAAYTGTSMAAAYVSGAEVLIRQALEQAGRANIDEAMIDEIMRNSADRIFDAATNAYYLELDLKKAIDSVMSGGVDAQGNTAATAQSVGSLNLSSSASGTVNVKGDKDYFSFTAEHTGTVKITISPTSGLTTRWDLTNSNGSTKIVTGKTLTFAVTAGKTYSFAVEGLAGTGDYSIAMNLSPSYVGLGTTNKKSISNQIVNSEKWYRFQVVRTAAFTFAGSVPTGTSNVTFEIYNSAMQRIGAYDTSWASSMNLSLRQGTGYFVRVVGSNSRVKFSIGPMAVSKAPVPRTASVGGDESSGAANGGATSAGVPAAAAFAPAAALNFVANGRAGFPKRTIWRAKGLLAACRRQCRARPSMVKRPKRSGRSELAQGLDAVGCGHVERQLRRRARCTLRK